MTANSARSFIVASGYGLTSRASVGVIGGSAVIPAGGVKPYSQDARFVQMDLQFNIGSGDGTRHLTFTLDTNLDLTFGVDRVTGQFFIVDAGTPQFSATGSVSAKLNANTMVQKR